MVKGFMKKHGLKLIVPLYMIFYLASFHWLEQRQTYGFHEIYSSFDSAIPFCEVFHYSICSVVLLYCGHSHLVYV